MALGRSRGTARSRVLCQRGGRHALRDRTRCGPASAGRARGRQGGVWTGLGDVPSSSACSTPRSTPMAEPLNSCGTIRWPGPAWRCGGEGRGADRALHRRARGVRTAARRLRPLESELAHRWRARLTAFEAIVRQGRGLASRRPARGVTRGRASEAGSASPLSKPIPCWIGPSSWSDQRPRRVRMAKALAIYEESWDLPVKQPAQQRWRNPCTSRAVGTLASDFY